MPTQEKAPSLLHDDILRHKYDKRSQMQKFQDFLLSFYYEAKFRIEFLYKIMFKKSPYYNKLEEKRVWNEKSEGLIVLLYGLYSHPAVWDKHISLFRAHPEFDLFVPYVPDAGNCSLEEASAPILTHVLDYTKKHPDKPICLIGFSNGGRLALWLETKLRKLAPKNPVKISSIAGAHFGSPIVNILETTKISKLIMKNVTSQELSYGSEKNKQLLSDVLAPLEQDVRRSFDFWATTEDITVPDLGSCLLNLGKGEIYHVVHGYGHNSIVKGIAKWQVPICLTWLKDPH